MSEETAPKVLTKEDLLRDRFGIQDYELEGLGVVRIRSVSREMVLGMRGLDPPLTALQQEQRVVSAAMVEPKMSEADVAAWQKASSAGEMEPLAAAIMKLSGLGKDAQKDAVKSPGN